MAVAGYKLKINGGSLVNHIIDVENVLQFDVESPDLDIDPDTDYAVQRATYDVVGNESAYSAAVIHHTDALPPALMFDSLSLTAALAYGLRKFRAAYSGAGVRVRRSSDNTEQDIGFSGEALDWSAANTFKGAGQLFVRTVYDQSGNGNNLIQTTNANQPELDTTGQEIDFSSGKSLASTSTVNLTATDEATIFSVAKTTDTFNTQIIFELSANLNTNSGSTYAYIDVNRFNGGANLNNIYSRGKDMSGTNYHLASQVINTSETNGLDRYKLFVDGSATGVTDNGSPAAMSGNFGNHTLYVGARAGSSLHLVGGFKELILIASALADTPRGNADTNIKTYHGIA